MPSTFRSDQPDQMLLLAPDVREWLPPGHLAHHVGDLVDALELSAFYVPYEGDVRPMTRADASPARTAIPKEDGRTSAPMVSLTPRRRATSPTPRARS